MQGRHFAIAAVSDFSVRENPPQEFIAVLLLHSGNPIALDNVRT
jgi:hypothetical protein